MRQAQYRRARQPGAAAACACDCATPNGCRVAKARMGRETAVGLWAGSAGNSAQFTAPAPQSRSGHQRLTGRALLRKVGATMTSRFRLKAATAPLSLLSRLDGVELVSLPAMIPGLPAS